MERTLIADLGAHVGETVSISGSVDVRRDQGKMVFFDFRDRSGFAQGVALPGSAAMETAKDVRNEYVVRVLGIVKKRPDKNVQADKQNGALELEIQKLEILSRAEIPFELGAQLNLDTYLDYQPFTLRSERAKRIFTLQETVLRAFREALKKESFVEFQAPAIVGGDAEGGAAAFKVEYLYGHAAYLATSPQFYKQILAGAFERVFTTPKVFRGEKHSTSRHVNEYSSMDFEMAFIKDHTDVMNMLEKTIRHILEKVKEGHADIFKKFNTQMPLVPDAIPALTLREAQKTLGSAEGPDLDPENERAICEWARKRHGSDFIFITHYPVAKRPFYTYEDEANPGFTKSFDLLLRGLEITTGGQRVHNYQTLVEKMRAKGLEPETFSFYLQAFKSGMPPHGGSATGLERLTARLLELPNVKEATLFPRDLNRIDTLLHGTDSPEN